MKNKTLLLFLIVLIAVTALVTGFVATRSGKVILMDVMVSDVVGFNLNSDALHFGRVMPGGTSEREIILNNTEARAQRAELHLRGKLAQWASMSQTSLLIEPRSIVRLNVSITVPENTQFGRYTGTLTVFFTSP